jgi:O-antigen ligase
MRITSNLKYYSLNYHLTPGAKKIPLFDILLFVIYGILFGYFILQPAIYSPDTNSYWHLDITRYPGYVLFLRTFKLIFADFFDYAVVGFQLIFALFSIHIFLKNFGNFLKLNVWLRIILLGILVFPLFPPLSTANNLCSEGLSYPLYLLLISLILDFLFRDKLKRIYLLMLVFVMLALTRGQFAVVMPIVILIFLLKYRKEAFQKKNLKYLLLLILIPFISNTIDSTYRKMVHGHFITTPYSYINAITLPLYLSSEADSALFENQDQKTLFLKTYKRIDSLDLLSSKVEGSDKDKYQLFHDNFPYICNQSFHNIGAKYFYEKHHDPFQNHIDTEHAAKKMFPILLSKHFKEWVSLYSISVFRGFGSVFVFIFYVVVCVLSGWKTLKKFTSENSLVFLASLLIISNALLVAVAVHTITRYTFYNFALGFIILIILSKKITSKL